MKRIVKLLIIPVILGIGICSIWQKESFDIFAIENEAITTTEHDWVKGKMKCEVFYDDNTTSGEIDFSGSISGGSIGGSGSTSNKNAIAYYISCKFKVLQENCDREQLGWHYL
ncbi:MAG: hypothetical protein E7071_08660 [Bacteroidales bacterium]|nr:hypothetical protein [Bacteroidales bacterium]